MQAELENVLRLRSRALTSQTLLAASALFDRRFPLISETAPSDATVCLSSQNRDDVISDADTDLE